MKKLTGIVCLLALMLTLTACVGAGDWKYEDLPGDYAVWRINLILGKKNTFTETAFLAVSTFQIGP